MKSNYYTTREAANLLGVSLRTAQLWVEKGTLSAWKTAGGHRRISRESVSKQLQLQGAVCDNEDNALSLLIIEDDRTLLKLYLMQVSTWPFKTNIYAAPNGYEGLVMMGEVRPDLLICDLRLPGVNGFQIIRSLCCIKRFHDTQIVAISGLEKEEIDAHGGLPSKVLLLGKPIDFIRLREIASSLWARKEQVDSPG